MAEHLKLNQWTNLEIHDFMIKNWGPVETEEAITEAENYIADRLRDYFMNNTRPKATHTELDICEKMILIYSFESEAILYLLRASILMEELEPVDGTEFYGFLGNFAKNPDPQLMDSVREYTKALCDEAESQHDLGVLCDDLELYIRDEYIPDVVARISDTMHNYYQKANDYFNHNKAADILNSIEPEKSHNAIIPFDKYITDLKGTFVRPLECYEMTQFVDRLATMHDYTRSQLLKNAEKFYDAESTHQNYDILEKALFVSDGENAYELSSALSKMGLQLHISFCGTLGTEYFAVKTYLNKYKDVIGLPENRRQADKLYNVITAMIKYIKKILDNFYSSDDLEIVAGMEYYRVMCADLEHLINLTRFKPAVPKEALSVSDQLEPEERQMLKNIDIYKALDMANDNSIKADTKAFYTEELINLAATESDDSASAAYYEKAALLDSSTHRYSGRIVIGLKNRLNKNECLTKTYKDRIGVLGEQANSLHRLYHDAPFDSIPMSERIKSFGLAFLALAAAILFVLTPLKDYIYSDDTVVPFIIMIAVCVIFSIGGLISGGLIGLFGGLLLGSIAGYVVCLAAGLIPVIALVAALVFFIKVIRPNSSRKKEYDKYLEENRIVDKAKNLMNDAVVVKNAFNTMNQCEGLDEIKAYYDNIIEKAQFYIKIANQ